MKEFHVLEYYAAGPNEGLPDFLQGNLKINKKLGDKPSEFLSDALQDLQLVTKRQDIEIDMNIWCRGDGKKCKVCLSGSIMIMRIDDNLSENIKDGLELQPWHFDNHTDIRLCAINGFRLGKIVETLHSFRLGTQEQIDNFKELFGSRREMVKYDPNNPLEFHMSIYNLIQDLKKVGL